MQIALLVLQSLLVAQDPSPPSAQELRAALDTMREGRPGESAFDDAVVHLPALIRSRSGWFVSSGAWLAGEHGRTECVPDLLDALAHENARAANVTAGMKGHVLDALLRLNAEVPSERLVERIEEETLAETYLLLARADEPDEDALHALLRAAPAENGAYWSTACLLAHLEANDLAEPLLVGDPIPVRVRVHDPGDHLDVYGGWFGRSHNMSSHRRWPPRIEWDVVPPAADDALDAARGVRQSHSRNLRGPERLGPTARLAIRGRLLDHMLGDCAERGLVGDPPDLGLHWTTADAYEQALARHLDGIRESLRHVALRLEALGQLRDALEVVERTRVRVEIQDLRTAEDLDPLPAPPKRPWLEVAD